jgi:hypothetical protein
MILFKDGKPAYLFTTSQGGKFMTASSFIFKIVTCLIIAGKLNEMRRNDA